ncbi:MAG: hypothetical protein AAF432_09865 [Planctomycetota bacterium]
MTTTAPPIHSRPDHGWRRYTVPVVLAVVTLLIVIRLGWWMTASPSDTVDYVAQLKQLSMGAQPTSGENGMDALAAASRIEQLIRSEVIAECTDRVSNLNSRDCYLVYDQMFHEPLELKDELPGLQVIERFRDAGGFDHLDRAAAADMFLRDFTLEDSHGGSPLMQVRFFGDVDDRDLLRLALASMRVAAMRGQHAEVCRYLQYALIVRHARAIHPILIDQLVATAMTSNIATELRHLLQEHSFDEQTLVDMQRLLSGAYAEPDIAHGVQGEELFAKDFAQWVFRDNGHGEGYLEPGLIRTVTNWGGDDDLPMSSFGGVLLENRTQTMERIEAYYGLVAEYAALSPSERAISPDTPQAFIASLPQRQVLLREITPMWPRFIDNHDETRADMRAAELMVAIERFRAVHGRLPVSQAELVPSCLDEPLVDPITERPFVYTLTSFGVSGYLISRSGLDRVDDLAVLLPNAVSLEQLDVELRAMTDDTVMNPQRTLWIDQ